MFFIIILCQIGNYVWYVCNATLRCAMLAQTTEWHARVQSCDVVNIINNISNPCTQYPSNICTLHIWQMATRNDFHCLSVNPDCVKNPVLKTLSKWSSGPAHQPPACAMAIRQFRVFDQKKSRSSQLISDLVLIVIIPMVSYYYTIV